MKCFKLQYPVEFIHVFVCVSGNGKTTLTLILSKLVFKIMIFFKAPLRFNFLLEEHVIKDV